MFRKFDNKIISILSISYKIHSNFKNISKILTAESIKVIRLVGNRLGSRICVSSPFRKLSENTNKCRNVSTIFLKLEIIKTF